MPKWLTILIIVLLGIGGMYAAYRITTDRLDAEHERYVRGLVVEYSREHTEPGEVSDTDAASSTSTTPGLGELGDAIVASGTAVELSEFDALRDPASSFFDFSVEIGAITIDEVLFQVGASWQNDDRTETYTITKIVQRANGIDLFYETEDETTYLFQMIQNPDDPDDFTIVGAPPSISVSVDTDPATDDDANEDDATSKRDDATTTTPDGTDDTDGDTTGSDDSTDDTPGEDNPTNDDNEPEYEIIYTTPTSTPTTTDNGNDNPDSDPIPTPDPADDPDDGTSTTTEPVSLAPTNTTPTTTDPDPNSEPSQPYNDGTYQYKADAQFVPYTPPLYDRTAEEDEVGIAP